MPMGGTLSRMGGMLSRRSRVSMLGERIPTPLRVEGMSPPISNSAEH
jgi:hypothetical protein